MVPLIGLIVSLLSLVVLGTIDAVDYNVNGMVYMCQFRAVLNILVVFASSVFFSLVVLVERVQRARRCCGQQPGNRQRNPAGQAVPRATKGQCAARAFWFLLAAVCDTIALYVSMLASSAVTSSLRSVLQQATIPFSMLTSYFVLGRRYAWGHMVAAALIVGGIVACLSSVMLSSDQISDPIWGLVYTLSCVPLALGACLKEWIMTHPKRPDDIHTVNAATVGFQLLLSVLLYPAAFLIQADDSTCTAANSTPATNSTTLAVSANTPTVSFGFLPALTANNSSTGEEMSHIFQNLWEGVTCGMAGVSSVANASAADVANCSYAVLTTWLAIVTICAFNIVMLWVIKYGSGVLYFISTAAVIPIVSLVSTTTWYSSLGLKALAFSAWQVVGLVVVVIGCGLYVYFLRREASPERIRARSLKDLARDASEDDAFFLSKSDQLDDPIIDHACFEEEWGDAFDADHPFDPDEDYGPYLPPPERVNE